MPSDPEVIGLQRNEERSHILRVSPGNNLSWPIEDTNLTYTIPSGRSKYKLLIATIFYMYAVLFSSTRFFCLFSISL